MTTINSRKLQQCTQDKYNNKQKTTNKNKHKTTTKIHKTTNNNSHNTTTTIRKRQL